MHIVLTRTLEGMILVRFWIDAWNLDQDTHRYNIRRDRADTRPFELSSHALLHLRLMLSESLKTCFGK